MRKLKVKDLLELIDGLREKGYDVDNMLLTHDDFFEWHTFWGVQVIEDRIYLEG